jgi:hypothetical protein
LYPFTSDSSSTTQMDLCSSSSDGGVFPNISWSSSLRGLSYPFIQQAVRYQNLCSSSSLSRVQDPSSEGVFLRLRCSFKPWRYIYLKLRFWVSWNPVTPRVLGSQWKIHPYGWVIFKRIRSYRRNTHERTSDWGLASSTVVVFLAYQFSSIMCRWCHGGGGNTTLEPGA